ncbi:MAG: hypothetical protein KME17_09710 [Cyanosarcina radialis HA8281-LM2]|jgi:hypothetical protein|nr:hypothetical protein [Cyanosarcina radialis HA8281-LM2]
MITLLKKFQNLRSWQRIRTGAIATLLLAALSPVYATQKSVAAPLTLQNQYPLNVTVEDVAEDPEDYIGRIVTVRSEPDPIDGSNAFELDDEGFLNLGLIDDDEVLVLNPYRISFPAIENNNPDFQVTGEVG